MWLAARLTAFDSLLCREPSQLSGLVAYQKSQAWTWILTGDLWHGSQVPWLLGHCTSVIDIINIIPTAMMLEISLKTA